MATKTKKKLMDEEGPTNSVGGGAIAGLGVGPKGEPPGPSNILAVLRRHRKYEEWNPNGFAGAKVFKVPSHVFEKCKHGKKKFVRYEVYVGGDQLGEEIRQYGRTNPKKPIIVEDEKTGSFMFLRYGGNERK